MAERLNSEQIEIIVQRLTQGIDDPSFGRTYAGYLRAVLSGCLPHQASAAIKSLDEALGIHRPEEQQQPQADASSPESGYSSERIYAEMLASTRRENAAYPIGGLVSRKISSGRVTEETHSKLVKGSGGVYYYTFSGEAALPNSLIVNNKTLVRIGQMVTNEFSITYGKSASQDQTNLVFARAGWAITVSVDSRPVPNANSRIKQEEYFLVFRGLPDSQTLSTRSSYREAHGFLLLPEDQRGRQDFATRLQSYKTSVSIIAGAFNK